MFKLIFKIGLVISAILLLGQISIGKETIAAYYLIALENASTYGVRKVKESKFLASMKPPSWIEKLFTRRDGFLPKSDQTVQREVPRTEATQPEPKVTATDRERVLRLLE